MNKLFSSKLNAINVGVKPFGDGVKEQNVPTAYVAWRPPVDAKLARLISSCPPSLEQKIEEANAEAVRRINAAEGHWVGLEKAIKAIPGFKENMIMHSGPPIAFDDMVLVQQLGVKRGAIHAGLAKTEEEAEGMIRAGEIELASCNDYYTVGAAAGIVTHNMVVNVCEDVKTGLKAYCIPFEGRNGLGAWGMYNEEIEANLQVIENEFAPAVDHVLKNFGDINVRNILAQGMQMGDESHTRQFACWGLLLEVMIPKLLHSDLDMATITKCVDMFLSTERWVHPLGMSTSLASMRSIKGLPYCTVVTSIAQNGVETGIKVADMGEQWFKAPAPSFVGQYFSTQWGPEHAVPYMGDSTATESYGMGAFAAAAAPAVLRLRNGGWREAIAQTEEMRQICAGRNNNFQIPNLDFTGPGAGIDIRKVVETGITPICHGGIVNKHGGQIGAGAARYPIEHYVAANYAFFEKHSN